MKELVKFYMKSCNILLGKSWQDKTKELLDELEANKNDATVLTALDEVHLRFKL